jgi:type VI secretion system protein ImpA
LRYEREYDQLRDLRREDDTSLPTGVWQSAVKRANWPELEALTTVLLLERSKDLMLAAWLGEAWLHLQALDGLPGSLALIAGLCERYPSTCIRRPRTVISRGGSFRWNGWCGATAMFC